MKEIEENKKIKIILIAIISILVILLGIEAFFILKDTKTIKNAKQGLDVNKTIQTSTNPENDVKEEQPTEKNTIKETPSEEKKEENKPEVKKNDTENGTRYKLEINCQANVINVYEKDSNGKYTKCIKAMACSTGYATPQSGTYYLKKYGGWEWKGLFGDVYGQYTTQVEGNILLHSVPYLRKYDKSSLEYWEYNKLGTAASMGCIRLTVADAYWVFYNCQAGTPVTFYRSSNPGPLGKPATPKISSDAEFKGWDPTDPDPNNPWNKTKPEPVKPVTPVKPEKPTEPEKPAEPEKPEEPSEPTNTTENEENNTINEINNETNEPNIENETDENNMNETENNNVEQSENSQD